MENEKLSLYELHKFKRDIKIIARLVSTIKSNLKKRINIMNEYFYLKENSKDEKKIEKYNNKKESVLKELDKDKLTCINIILNTLEIFDIENDKGDLVTKEYLESCKLETLLDYMDGILIELEEITKLQN